MDNKSSIGKIIVYVMIFSILAFILGAAYKEGKMKKIIQYCVEQHMNDDDTLNCVYEATYIEPNDWR